MRRFYQVVCLLFSSLVLISCSQDKNGKNKSSKEKTEFEITRDSLIQKYNAITVKDTPINKYSFLFQNELISKKRLLAFTGFISDVYKKDSNYIVQIIHEELYDKFIVNTIIDSIQMEEIRPLLLSGKTNSGCFILKISKIKSASPALELDYNPGEPPSEDDDGTPPSISVGDFGETRIFILKANMVDYYFR